MALRCQKDQKNGNNNSAWPQKNSNHISKAQFGQVAGIAVAAKVQKVTRTTFPKEKSTQPSMVGRGVSIVDPRLLASECEKTPKDTLEHLHGPKP